MQKSTEKIRIAFCITELDPGGAERNLFQLVKRLDRATWEPHIYSLQAGGALVTDFEAEEIPVTCLKVSKQNPIGAILRLTQELKQFRPKILQTFLYHANIAGRLAAWLARIPIVVSGIRVAEKRSRMRLRLDRLTDRFVSQHVCVSEAVAKFMIKEARLPAEKVITIANGVDARIYRDATPTNLADYDIPPESNTLLFVGRLDEQKAPFDLLSACESILAERQNLQLLLVGDGPLKSDIIEWIQQQQLTHRIHLAGYQNEVSGFYQAADCLVLPSHWEGMPNVVLEAMAAGLPIIATDVEGSCEIIEHNKTGLLVPANCTQALREAIEYFLENPHVMCKQASLAQDIVAKEFTHEAMVQKYTDMYQNLVLEKQS